MKYEEELFQYLDSIRSDIDFYTLELEYMESFLTWMHLWDNYLYFRQNARLEQNEDEPFPRYVL